MKLAITAPKGKMGKLVIREALKRPDDFEIVGAIAPAGRDYLGHDIGEVARVG